jgi:hypothetical protein
MPIEAARSAISNVYARYFNATGVVCSNDKHGGAPFCSGKHSRFRQRPWATKSAQRAAIAADEGTCPGTGPALRAQVDLEPPRSISLSIARRVPPTRAMALVEQGRGGRHPAHWSRPPTVDARRRALRQPNRQLVF